MKRNRVRHSICAAVVLVLSVGTALAQSSHDDWLATRTRKQARHHLIAPATRADAFTLVTIRFYSDASGYLVGVGEARNNSAFDLSYSRLNFRFFDSSGTDLGGEWTYLHGGANARILSNQRYESVLLHGTTGFFKLWTTIPASSMSSYSVASAGEELPFAAPLASSGNRAGLPAAWYPMVFVAGRPSIVGQQVTGSVLNDDPITPFCPCGLQRILTYSVRVSVAAYQDGVITDVQSTLAVGPQTVTPPGEPATTGLSLHEEARFAIDLARPANSVGNLSVEWEEIGVLPANLSFSDEGGVGTISLAGKWGGWSAVPDVPWMTVTQGSRSVYPNGDVAFAVSRNTTSQVRTGTIDISGTIVRVTQAAQCESSISPAVIFVGPGVVDQSLPVRFTSTCALSISSSASWLSVTPGFPISGMLKFQVLQPNLTGETRSGVITVGTSSLTVYQSPGGRNADFNNDGSLDLLWHHATDGRVATWLMKGTQLVDGTLLNPGQAPDTNWTPVAVGDMRRDGMADIVWQNTADGSISLWEMAGTSMTDGRPVSPSPVTDTNWKIRGFADFNQDGDGDLVWQHDGDGRLAVWFMQFKLYQPVMLQGDPLGPGQVTDLDWKIVGTGDFNRDGWPDLVWQHQGDGRIAVWKMRQTVLVDGDLISPGQIADLDWKIRAVGDINGDDMADGRHNHDSRCVSGACA